MAPRRRTFVAYAATVVAAAAALLGAARVADARRTSALLSSPGPKRDADAD